MHNLKLKIPSPIRETRVFPKDVSTLTFTQATEALERIIFQELEEKPISSGTLLATLVKAQKRLIKHLATFWQRRELASAIRKVQRKIEARDAAADQYLLPIFDALPKRISITGKQRSLGAAMHQEALEYLESLEKHRLIESPRLIQMRALVALMEKYVGAEPNITVREVCEREAK